MGVEAQPSGLGWLPGGDLLVASMNDRRVLRRAPDGGVAVDADAGKLTTGHLNDMVVDRQGRAYVGNFGFDIRAAASRRQPAWCASTPTVPPRSWRVTCSADRRHVTIPHALA